MKRLLFPIPLLMLVACEQVGDGTLNTAERDADAIIETESVPDDLADGENMQSRIDGNSTLHGDEAPRP